MLLLAACSSPARRTGHLASGPLAMATVLVACLAAAAPAQAELVPEALTAALQNFSFELPFSIPERGRRLSAGCPVYTGYNLLRSSSIPPLCTTTTTTAAPSATASVVTSDTGTSTTESTSSTTSASTTTTTRVVVGCKAPHALYDLGSSCQDLAAGTTCSADVGSSAHSCIQQGTIEFSCPAGNVVNSEPYLVSRGAVKCRACHISMHVVDVDQRSGYFQGTIEWGPNMIDGNVDETLIDRYYVLIVDSCNVVLSVVGMLPKRADLDASCCLTDAYKLTFAARLPSNHDRFTVMAVKDATPKFIVQGGISSAKIVDVVAATAVSLAGSREKLWVLSALTFIMVASHSAQRH